MNNILERKDVLNFKQALITQKYVYAFFQYKRTKFVIANYRDKET